MAYIEVPYSSGETQPYRTFNLPNDSSARTLQDLKFPEKGGGFGFISGNEISSVVRNRFIYWRYSNGSLEILEDSLDTTLRSGWLKFIFSNTCVLHAEAFEQNNYVQMLVCTAGSAVRLLFRHPNVLVKEHTMGASRFAQSIFHEVETPRQNVVPVGALQQPGQLRCATARLRYSDGTALFAFCLTTGSVILVEMPPINSEGSDNADKAKIVELRQASMMSKLWNGIVPSFATRGDAISPDTATDAIFLDDGRPTLLLTVCRDHKLRVWNVETRDLAAVMDLLECLQDKMDIRSLQMKSQGHSLRRSHSVYGMKDKTSVGIHLNFISRSYIVIFALNDASLDVQSCLVPVRRFVCDPRQDVVDWAVVPSASQVWLLMQSANGYSLSTNDLREPSNPNSAITPALFLADVLWNDEEDGESETGLTLVSLHQDPQEACLDAVFTPGRFSGIAIARALTALRQNSDSSATYVPNQQPSGSADALREEIITLVENKIADSLAELSAAHELSMHDDEVSEAELLQIRMLHWSEFFASVVDYQQTCVARPVGLLVDPATGLIGVIRKAGLSVFRHADPVEICSFLPLPMISRHTLRAVTKQSFVGTSADIGSPSLLILLRHCRYLQHCVGSQAMMQLYAQLEMANEDPSTLGTALLSECLRQEHELEIVRRLSAADKLMEAFLQLIEIAEDLQDADDFSDASETDERVVGTLSHPERFLFASPLGVDCTTRSVDCILTARLRLAVSLLLIQQLLTNSSSCASAGDWLSTEMMSRLRGPIRIRVVNLIRNLVLMRWLSAVRLCTPSQHMMDRVASQLVLLGCASTTSSTSTTAEFRRPLLDLFFEASAGDQMRRRLRETGLLDISPNEPPQQLWADIFPVGAGYLQAAICPSSANMVLTLFQFLLSRGQISVLLKLTRLLDSWWQLDPSLVHYARGVALLNAGHPQRGLYYIIEALNGLSKVGDAHNSSVLPDAVLGRTSLQKSLNLLQVNIALKVMRTLEIAEEPLLVVELAHRALLWLDVSSAPSRSPVEGSDEDFSADEERRLRLREALHKNRAPSVDSSICEEPESTDEEQQLRGVLWTSIFKHELAVGRNDKAFSALLSNTDDSSRRDCLRQLIVTLCDRRQLDALVNFKYGEMEEEFVAILQSRARAVDLNVYNYYDLLYAFHIHKGNYRGAAAVMYEQATRVGLEIRSLAGVQKQARSYLAALTAFRLVHPDFQWLVPPPTTASDNEEVLDLDVDLVELVDIERAYALVRARLRVAEMDIEHSLLSAGPLGVVDVCRGLLQLGLYGEARRLLLLFKRPLEPLFETLAGRCVTLPMATAGASGPQAHRDLQLEKAVLVECLEEVRPGPGYEGISAAQLAWTLLQAYLQEHASGNYWRCVVAKLLSSGHRPPAWLAAEGKRRQAAALLRLYMLHDEVEAAASLAIECIDTATSRGGGPSVACQELRWLPHMWIAQLLAGLQVLAATSAQCALMHKQLSRKRQEYLSLLQRAAKDAAAVRLASRRAQIQMEVTPLM